jgi:hypothetical protein
MISPSLDNLIPDLKISTMEYSNRPCNLGQLSKSWFAIHEIFQQRFYKKIEDVKSLRFLKEQAIIRTIALVALVVTLTAIINAILNASNNRTQLR